MKKLIYEVRNILYKKTIIPPKNICICSFSGGQDSIVLFIILLHLQKQLDIHIKLLHFHHFWQQKNFFSTQQVWKVSFLFKNSIYIIPSEGFLNSEKKARQWRQQGLERISSLEKSNQILTGHTASDRIETSLWHLIRGTSPQGLISMKWQTILVTQTQFFHFSKFIIKKKFTIKIQQFSKKETAIFFKKIKNKKILKNYVNNLVPFQKSKAFDPKKLCFFGSKVSDSPTKGGKKVLNGKNHQNKTKRIISTNTIENLFFHFQKNTGTTYSFLMQNASFFQKNILRPLLTLHRNDITFFSKKYRLPVISDPTNQKLCWSRNRIRYQLIPVLKYFFNPNTEYLVNNFVEITSDEQKYIEFIIQKILKYWKEKPQKSYEIRQQLQLLPKAIQRRVLQKLFQSYTNLQPNLIQIEFLRINSNKNF